MINKVHEEDINKIVTLRISIFKEYRKINSIEEENELISLNTKYFETLIHDNNFCGFYEEIDGKIISIALATILQYPPINYGNTGKYGYIFNVYTDTAYRNQGRALRITEMLVKELKSRGISKITLDANKTSRAIYEKLGFTVAGLHMVL